MALARDHLDGESARAPAPREIGVADASFDEWKFECSLIRHCNRKSLHNTTYCFSEKYRTTLTIVTRLLRSWRQRRRRLTSWPLPAMCVLMPRGN